MIVSGLLWAAVALVLTGNDIATGFTVLFFGGFLIFPLSLLLCQVLLKRPKLSPDNGLRHLALESTIAMIALLFVAFLMVEPLPDLVFPVAALAVGTHYFAFKTLYGDRTYWVMGAAITLAGFAGIYGPLASPVLLAAVVGAIEIAIGIYLTLRDRGAQSADGQRS